MSQISLQSVPRPAPARPVLPSRPEFEHWVRTALSHLYDVPALQGHPLAPFMGGAAGPGGQSQRLREELLGAIHALQPAPGTRQQTPAWRAYRILELRYIEGLTPAETMAELAISRSQFYKEQARVVAAVTELLWQKLDAPPPAIVPAPSDEQTLSRKEIALTEAERLRNHSQQTTVDLGQVLRDLRPLVDSLAQIRHVAVRYTIMAGLRIAHADRVMARQAILNVATYALDRAPGGQVELMSFQGLADVGVWVMAMQPSGFPATPAPPAAMLRQGVGLEVGQRLMAAMKGELSVVETQPERWIAHLRWQAPGAATLLVVDDNEGFISLVSRYLAGSNCRVIGATSVAQAKQLLAANEVAAILSDVMMPDEDGWEFLAAVKAAPETAAIPFVVCSVLREPELAAALGAAACLTKPLTLAALHETLARWIEIAPSPETGNPG